MKDSILFVAWLFFGLFVACVITFNLLKDTAIKKTKQTIVWLRCLPGHKWTCKAAEGIPPTDEQAITIAGFWDYAKMYCKRCGKESELNQRGKNNANRR